MSERINPAPAWVDFTDVPRDGEGVDAADVKLPVLDLLGNDKFLLQTIAGMQQEIAALKSRQGGFTLGIQQSLTSEPNRSYTIPVAINRVANDTESVALALTGLPAGVNAVWVGLNANPTTGNSATLQLDIGDSVVAGAYDLILTGTGSQNSATASMRLNLSAATLPASFDINLDGGLYTTNENGSTTFGYTFDVTRQGGFSSNITFNVLNLPAGWTLAWQGNPVSGNKSNQFEAVALTVTAPVGTLGGMYNLQITAAGGGITRATSVLANVSQPSTSQLDFDISADLAFIQWVNLETVHIDRSKGYSGPVTITVPRPPARLMPDGSYNSGPIIMVNGQPWTATVTGNTATITALDSAGWTGSSVWAIPPFYTATRSVVTGSASAVINGQQVTKHFSVLWSWGNHI